MRDYKESKVKIQDIERQGAYFKTAVTNNLLKLMQGDVIEFETSIWKTFVKVDFELSKEMGTTVLYAEQIDIERYKYYDRKS